MKVVEPIKSPVMGDLFNSNEKVIVPSYQRRFSWEREHFEDLWSDFNSIDKGETHFFGTIVFMSDIHRGQSVNTLEVVDGQQRITTVSILLCAIRDYLEDNFGPKVKKRVKDIEESLWLTDRDGHVQGKRLKLGNLDEESYKNLIKSNPEEIENKNIKEAYNFFYEKLDTIDLEKIKEIHDKALDNLKFVSITAKGHEDAYQLFEAMNNRGLKLSPIDLMKNYLLMIASKKDNVNEKTVENVWGKIIKNIDKLDIRNPAETFFRQYFMSTDKLDINEKITKNKLYEPTFKDAINETEDIENLLRDVKKQSKLYRKMLNQNIKRFDRSKNIEINRLLKDAKTVSITSFTLFLRAFKELNDVKKIKKIIEMANVLLVRRQICDKSTGKHDTFFNHLAQNAFDSDAPLKYIRNYIESDERLPNDETFKEYFKSEDFQRNDRTRYFLSKIEENYFRQGGVRVSESRYDVHIEHILPELYCKSLRKLWLEKFGITKEQHNEYKKKIGNLTLLESDPNIRASNRTLKKKKGYYDDETDFEMTQKLTKYDKWGIEEIEKRSEDLAEIATEIWSITSIN